MTGSSLGFPALWLRHNCPCPQCLDPVTGQRLIEVTAIPNGCGVTVEAETAESVTVVFAPDGHRAVFRRTWLADRARPADRAAADPRTEDGKRLWLAADLAVAPGADPELSPFPVADWEAYLATDAVRAACLDAVATLGFTLLRGVPVTPGSVLRVAETFGFVRETNYGKLFDVRVVADPANLAFTSRAIPPHTDNPYRDPVPTLQLLHCLRDADLGLHGTGRTGRAGLALAANVPLSGTTCLVAWQLGNGS